jgi:hypothetical protein
MVDMGICLARLHLKQEHLTYGTELDWHFKDLVWMQTFSCLLLCFKKRILGSCLGWYGDMAFV